MTAASKVKVKKEIYLWAIEESRRDFGEIKKRFENIEKWMSQEDYPTFRQLEKYEAEIKNRIKIPNVCREFGIEYIDLLQFMRELGIRL